MPDWMQHGNAAPDGAPFNGWFVGNLGVWSTQNGAAYDPQGMALRDTPSLEIKWGFHPKGQRRPGGWAAPSDKASVSLLVRGRFLVKFRSLENPGRETTHLLKSEGDYVIWREEVEHTWQAEEDSVILTVRWRR
jgi:hypothetical protein